MCLHHECIRRLSPPPSLDPMDHSLVEEGQSRASPSRRRRLRAREAPFPRSYSASAARLISRRGSSQPSSISLVRGMPRAQDRAPSRPKCDLELPVESVPRPSADALSSSRKSLLTARRARRAVPVLGAGSSYASPDRRSYPMSSPTAPFGTARWWRKRRLRHSPPPLRDAWVQSHAVIRPPLCVIFRHVRRLKARPLRCNTRHYHSPRSAR